MIEDLSRQGDVARYGTIYFQVSAISNLPSYIVHHRTTDLRGRDIGFSLLPGLCATQRFLQAPCRGFTTRLVQQRMPSQEIPFSFVLGIISPYPYSFNFKVTSSYLAAL